MAIINKIDYFSGAFVSFLISKKVAPALFEAGENSKIIKFTTDKDYKVYLKYSKTPKQSTIKHIRYTKWNIGFTGNDMARLKMFYENGRENYIVCLCTNDKFNATAIAVLNYCDAIKCLGTDSVNENKILTVKHQKGSSKLYCHGTALNEDDAIETLFDFRKYFVL